MTALEQDILRALASEQYELAGCLADSLGAMVDASDPVAVQRALAFLREALQTARVKRAHMAHQAETLSGLRRLCSPLPESRPEISLMG